MQRADDARDSIAMGGFFEELAARCATARTYLCVGLDPRASSAAEAEAKCVALVEATHEYACCFKPNAAFFEARGAEGVAALKRVVAKVHGVGGLVVLDCKRGDVGSTAEAYAEACYEDLDADCVTLSPYLGYDAIGPFLSGKYCGKGCFVLCATSNGSAEEVQDPELRSLVARLCRDDGAWGLKTPAASRPLGLVVGATKPEAVVAARSANGDAWILAPGVGAQGATAADVVGAALAGGGGGDTAGGGALRLVVPVSRAIANAPDPRAKARDLRDEINAAVEAAAPSSSSAIKAHQRAFIDCVLSTGALKFGAFTLKSGRSSPYFFNAGKVCDGANVAKLFDAYAAAVAACGVAFDVVFGPAYKGIPLCAGVAASLAAKHGVDVSFAYNRKEAKDHGEGGTLVGADVAGKRVLLVDDVISAGTAVREATAILKANGANLVAVCVAVDRQEVTGGADAPPPGAPRVSAVDAVRADLGVPVVPIVTLTDLLAYLDAAKGADAETTKHADAVREYRRVYGAC